MSSFLEKNHPASNSFADVLDLLKELLEENK